jgi:hypothetical protein
MEKPPVVVNEAVDEEPSVEQVIEFLKKHNRFYAAALIRRIHDRSKQTSDN